MRHLVAGAVVFSLVTFACGGPSEQAAEPAPVAEQSDPRAATAPEGTPSADLDEAPDFTIATLDGGTFTLSDHRGTPVVLNFWAPW